MDQAMAEFPLALFTTLAPVGVGAFALLAIAFFTVRFSDEELKKIDMMTLVPLGFILGGFALSFLYSTNPQSALCGIVGWGFSPLSNEMVAGVLTFLLAVVYWVFAMAGKLGILARKIFCTVVAALGIVFSFLVGLAYVTPAVVSWYVIFPPFEILGFSLLGGMVLGTFVLALSGALSTAKSTNLFKVTVMIVAAIGFFLGVGSMFSHLGYVDTLATATASGTVLVAGVVGYVGMFVVCLLLALVLEIIALYKSSTTLIMGLGVAWGLAGIVIARLVFYALQMPSGL
ncbi:MAG: DmsC/YnfH family molybdoenzyme membrane anchor subunit [Raoultibacter sp.]